MIGPANGKRPSIDSSVFIAEGAVVTGDVTIGADASVWYGTVIRGDVNWVRIGERTNIQDGSVLHVTHETHPLSIGDDVTCGHAVRLHGCTIERLTLIGIGAIVLDGAVIRTGAMVAAGTLVPPGFEVPSGVIVAGVPAKVLREMTPAEHEGLTEAARNYVTYAQAAMNERSKQ